MEVFTPESDYLKETVGASLTAGLTQMLVDQPIDAVEYLGNYLLEEVRKIEEAECQQQRYIDLENAVKRKDEAKMEALKKDEARSEAMKKGTVAGEPELVALLQKEDDILKLYPKVLEAIKVATGAQAVYAGIRSDPETLSFISATEGCDMVGKSLNKEEGILFDLFEEREQYQSELAEAENLLNNAETPEDEDFARIAKSKLQQYPDHVLVENAVRADRIKFFGPQLIGAFAAVTIRYESALHTEGVGPPSTEDQDTISAAQAKNVRLPRTTPRPITIEAVLALHTLGTSKLLDTNSTQICNEWATLLGQAHARADAIKWRDSALLREDAVLNNEALLAEITKAETAEQATAEAELAAIDSNDSLSEANKEIAKQRLKAQHAAAVLRRACLPTLADLASDAIPPSPAASKLILAALCLGAGVTQPNEELCLPGTDTGHWPKLAMILKRNLIPAIAATSSQAESIIPENNSEETTQDQSPSAHKDFVDIILEDVKQPGSLPISAVKDALADLTTSSFSDFYSPQLLVQLHTWATDLITLWEHAKAVADAEEEALAAASSTHESS